MEDKIKVKFWKIGTAMIRYLDQLKDNVDEICNKLDYESVSKNKLIFKIYPERNEINVNDIEFTLYRSKNKSSNVSNSIIDQYLRIVYFLFKKEFNINKSLNGTSKYYEVTLDFKKLKDKITELYKISLKILNEFIQNKLMETEFVDFDDSEQSFWLSFVFSQYQYMKFVNSNSENKKFDIRLYYFYIPNYSEFLSENESNQLFDALKNFISNIGKNPSIEFIFPYTQFIDKIRQNEVKINENKECLDTLIEKINASLVDKFQNLVINNETQQLKTSYSKLASIRDYVQMLRETIKFELPPYQREYVWKFDNIKELLDRLFSTHSNKNYYLNNVIFYKLQDNKYSLLDGQQRTLTISIIVLCLWKVTMGQMYLKIDPSRPENEWSEKLTKELNKYKGLSFIFWHAYNLIKHHRNKPHLSVYESSNNYEHLKNIGQLINKVDDNIFKEIENYIIGYALDIHGDLNLSKLNDFATRFLDSSYLTVTIVDKINPEELFETLNSTGVQLTNFELFINFVYYKLIDLKSKDYSFLTSEFKDESVVIEDIRKKLFDKYIPTKSEDKDNKKIDKFNDHFNDFTEHIYFRIVKLRSSKCENNHCLIKSNKECSYFDDNAEKIELIDKNNNKKDKINQQKLQFVFEYLCHSKNNIEKVLQVFYKYFAIFIYLTLPEENRTLPYFQNVKELTRFKEENSLFKFMLRICKLDVTKSILWDILENNNYFCARKNDDKSNNIIKENIIKNYLLYLEKAILVWKLLDFKGQSMTEVFKSLLLNINLNQAETIDYSKRFKNVIRNSKFFNIDDIRLNNLKSIIHSKFSSTDDSGNSKNIYIKIFLARVNYYLKNNMSMFPNMKLNQSLDWNRFLDSCDLDHNIAKESTIQKKLEATKWDEVKPYIFKMGNLSLLEESENRKKSNDANITYRSQNDNNYTEHGYIDANDKYILNSSELTTKWINQIDKNDSKEWVNENIHKSLKNIDKKTNQYIELFTKMYLENDETKL
ncbi:DUF262 domain-containing protein [Mycoplasma sp. 21DD0573]|uniref:DUF262 domain-containing protein n=1 Tax=unclassified Mycoplasma TaxID=2683645 RepID=UPI002B1D0672|nr:DUF262 domain-containing protein [Mycoplasma sp. 21DD0573]MEA4276187.1 DUF262 domain-containing protein [Mycoplasma sp. 21DD0573]